jgi:hypothetical protein
VDGLKKVWFLAGRERQEVVEQAERPVEIRSKFPEGGGASRSNSPVNFEVISQSLPTHGNF